MTTRSATDPRSNYEVDPSAVNSSYKWLIVVMLWFICLFNYADRQAMAAVFPLLKKEFHLSKTELGIIGSAFMYVYAFGAPVAGWIADKFRRKDLILGGCMFWSFVTVTTGWCRKTSHFIMVRCLEGFGETFYFPASMSLISDYHGPQTRSRALSSHQSSVYIGTILGSWIGALIGEKYNWRYGFYLFGTLGMVLSLVLYRILKEPKRGGLEAAADLQAHGHAAAASEMSNLTFAERYSFLKKPAVLMLMLGFMLANFVATIFLTWTPTYLTEKFKFKVTAAGLNGQVYIQVASAIAVPIAGYLADRYSRRFKAGRVYIQFGGLLLGAGFVSTIGFTHHVSTVLFAMAGFGFFKGFYDSGIFASLYDCVKSEARGSAAGIMNTIGWGGGALGPTFTGYFSDHGPSKDPIVNMSSAIGYCGIVYILGALALITAARLIASESKKQAAIP